MVKSCVFFHLALILDIYTTVYLRSTTDFQNILVYRMVRSVPNSDDISALAWVPRTELGTAGAEFVRANR